MPYHVVIFKIKNGYDDTDVENVPFIIKAPSHDDKIINALIHSDDLDIMTCIFRLVLDHGHDMKGLSELYTILRESSITNSTVENNKEQYMEYLRTYKKALRRFLIMMSYVSEELGSRHTYLSIRQRKIIHC